MTMKKLIILCSFFLLFSCENNLLDQETERLTLLAMFEDIETMATSVACEDASEWSFTAYGNQACGGPQGFIAYSNQINVTEFLTLVENYTNAERAYNIKWGIVSDCSLFAMPSGVSCENGNAVLNY